MNMKVLCCILIVAVVVLTAVCLWQRHIIQSKNRWLTHFINESIKYRDLYNSLYNRQLKDKHTTKNNNG